MNYSEAEAARKLGISVEHLRALVRQHINPEGDVPVVERFRAADLIVLRVLSERSLGTGK